MGNQINLQVSGNADHADALAPYRGYTQAQADEVTNKYKSNDMEFGLTLEALTTLLADSEAAEKVRKAYARGANGTTINALEFLSTLALIANGNTAETADSLFTTFDFNDKNQISYDELTILVISVCRGLKVASGLGQEPADEKIEEVTKTAFNPDGDVSRDAFKQFVFDKLNIAPKEEAPKEEAPKEEAPKEKHQREEAPERRSTQREAPKEEEREEAPEERAPKEEDQRRKHRRKKRERREKHQRRAPKEEAPKEEAPKEEAPKEEAPKEEAPKEEAPKEEAPKEEAPKEEAPKEEAPKEGSTKGGSTKGGST